MRSYLFLITCLGLLLNMLNSTNAAEEWEYVSPSPGSEYVNPENDIALRNGDPIDISSLNNELVTITGTKSGMISVRSKLSRDGMTLFFIPSCKFQYGEKVLVSIPAGINTSTGKTMPALEFEFKIKTSDNLDKLREFYQWEERENMQLMQQASVPHNEKQADFNLITYGNYDLPQNFPQPLVSVLNEPVPGYSFCTPRPVETPTNTYAPYSLIIDHHGTPVFYRQWHMRTSLLQVIPNNRLVYGQFDEDHPEDCVFYIMNNKYQHLDTLTMGNGYIPDRHSVFVKENGNHLLICYDAQQIDMSKVVPGGNPNATVIGLVIQELDADHNVLFQWRSWDHFNITDAVGINLTSPFVDYVHANSAYPTPDGHIVVSCRNMCEITKINRNNGEIIWRFGKNAVNNMFTINNDPHGFYWQHDANYHPGDTLTLYNNDTKQGQGYSSSMKYVMDEDNHTATLVWSYVNLPPIHAPATGSSKLLESGNNLICWGFTWPVSFTEVNIQHNKQWEVKFPDNIWQYQVFRDEWETDVFEAEEDTLDFGLNAAGSPLTKSTLITNNTAEDLEITSASNHEAEFTLLTPLPLTIPAQESVEMSVQYLSSTQGEFNDILTFNNDGFFAGNLNQRIAIQVALTGSSYYSTGISTYKEEKSQIYPVPAGERLLIASKKQMIDKIRVLSMNTSCLQEYEAVRKKQYEIDLSMLSPGIYLLELFYIDSHQREIHRIIKK